MAAPKIGFIGFGEVGYILSEAMNEAGAEVTVYDVLLDDPSRADDIRERIAETGSEVGTLEEVVKNNDYILSTVITQAAKKVAQTVAPMLKSGQIYVDLNSTCPSVKVEIGRIIAAAGADFIEGAILGAVGATGVETRIFTAGEKRQEIADLFNRMGMNVQPYSTEIGKASMFKMLRSIFSKGVEVLLLEMLVAAKRADIDKDLWEDIARFMTSKPFDKIGDNWMRSHAVAYERRYYEMLQVVETMKELNIEPVMSERTAAYFKQSVDMDMSKSFPEKPESFYEVTKFIDENLRQ
ncbi:MAG: NAD(P)-dependent oxidoreductase [Planctomycetota bacterium]|jgi:3-hydroxyisobutyrate dehydrogenase-like beta-hydroxyacid dehydrogenase